MYRWLFSYICIWKQHNILHTLCSHNIYNKAMIVSSYCYKEKLLVPDQTLCSFARIPGKAPRLHARVCRISCSSLLQQGAVCSHSQDRQALPSMAGSDDRPDILVDIKYLKIFSKRTFLPDETLLFFHFTDSLIQ